MVLNNNVSFDTMRCRRQQDLRPTCNSCLLTLNKRISGVSHALIPAPTESVALTFPTSSVVVML